MHTVTKWMMAVALVAGPMVAQAQTYDLDITMTGLLQTTFIGNFTFNAGGTCFGSAPYCAAGATPDFTNVNISDPVNGGAFTGANGSQNAAGGFVDLVNFEGLPPSADSSEVFQLSFNIAPPLGGAAKSIGLSNVVFTIDENSTGIYSCSTTPGQIGGVGCPTTTLTKAPEIDPASAAGGITLLLGGLSVMRGRRRIMPSPLAS